MSSIGLYVLIEMVGTVVWFLCYTVALSNGRTRRHRLAIGAGWLGVWMMGTAAALYMSLEDWIIIHPAGDPHALSDKANQLLFGTAYLVGGLGFLVTCLGVRAAARARRAYQARKRQSPRKVEPQQQPVVDNWFAHSEPDTV